MIGRRALVPAWACISRFPLTFPAKAGTHFSATRNFLEQSQSVASEDGLVLWNDRPRLSPGKRVN
jgi:hypothetical protein